MTLCGVLKNILLVVASVLIWGTVVSGLQVLGYGIALVGLTYYGVGYKGMVAYYTGARALAVEIWEGHVSGEKKFEEGIGPKRKVWQNLGMAFFVCFVVLLWIGIRRE